MNGLFETTLTDQDRSVVFSQPESECIYNSSLFSYRSFSFINVTAELPSYNCTGIMKFLSLFHLISLLCCHSEIREASLNTIGHLSCTYSVLSIWGWISQHSTILGMICSWIFCVKTVRLIFCLFWISHIFSVFWNTFIFNVHCTLLIKYLCLCLLPVFKVQDFRTNGRIWLTIHTLCIFKFIRMLVFCYY